MRKCNYVLTRAALSDERSDIEDIVTKTCLPSSGYMNAGLPRHREEVDLPKNKRRDRYRYNHQREGSYNPPHVDALGSFHFIPLLVHRDHYVLQRDRIKIGEFELLNRIKTAAMRSRRLPTLTKTECLSNPFLTPVIARITKSGKNGNPRRAGLNGTYGPVAPLAGMRPGLTGWDWMP